MSEEIWVDILPPWKPTYRVSNLGRVWSNSRRAGFIQPKPHHQNPSTIIYNLWESGGKKRSITQKKLLNLHFPTILPEGEEWVVVEEYPNYHLSNMGRVYSSVSREFLTLYEQITYKPTHLKEGGYWGYKLCNQGRCRFYPIHLLIGRYFIPNPHNHPCVLHRGDNRRDNSIENLYWGNHSQNAQERWDRDRKTP